MDPKLTPEERKLREEVLRHDFPFDAKAWVSMEALLNQEKEKIPAGIPPKTVDVPPGPGRKWGLLLILLFSFGVGSASLFWWNLNLQSKRLTGEDSMSKGTGKASGPAIRADNEAQDATSFPSEINPEASNANENDRINIESRLAEKASGSAVKNAGQISSRPVGINSIRKPEPFQSSQKTETPRDMMYDSGRLDPNTIRQSEFAIPGPGEINPSKMQESAQALPIWPLAKVSQLDTCMTKDSMIRPLKIQTYSIRRLERGWIFGLNANTVDYNPLRLSTLPHLGYFYAYRFRPGTWLQAELVAKYVSGYSLSARFVDIIPGGMRENILNTNNLLFFEVPMLIKHRYHPDQSWLLGIKPSGNFKLFTSGLSAVTNNGPSRFLSNQDGVRRFDLGLVLGWEWRFRQVWALDVRYNQGFFDLTYDQFYKDKSTHLNSDLQVSFRYMPRKKIRQHAPKTLFPVPGGR